MNNNNNNQTSLLEVVAVIVFLGLGVAFTYVVDSIILSVIFAAGIMALLALIVFGVITFWQKVDKKKFKKYSIIIGSSIVGILIALGIANASIPTLSQEEIKAMVISELDSQVEKVKNELGISELSVDLDIYDYTYEKPTIFSNGYIRFYFDDYYVSTQFAELNKGEYNEDTYNKYLRIDSLEYDDVKIPKYRVSISRRSSIFGAEFKDSLGNKYTFGDGVIYKNGNPVYGGSSSSSSSYKSSKCIMCNGSGYVRYYSGKYDEGTVGPCTSCGGDGRD